MDPVRAGILLLILGTFSGCVGEVVTPDPSPGTESGECLSDGTCDEGLTCLSNRCEIASANDEAPNNIANNVANNSTSTNNSNNSTAPNNSTFIPNNGTNNVAIPDECTAQNQADVYERRIEPLVTGGQPSSCNQCHLKAVDLASFVQDTPCESMACLVDLQLVDLATPQMSPILQQIMLAEPTELITEEVIQSEYDGFRAWIEFSALETPTGTCHSAICGDVTDPCNSGTVSSPPDGVLTPLGECSEEAVVTAFQTAVFSSRDRCAGCHNPLGPRNDEDQNPVYWLDANFDDGGEYGAALRTMYNVIGRRYINAAEPAESVLLLKPLPESRGGVIHAGGDKLTGTDDATYLSWLDWINLYLDCYDTGNVGTLPSTPYITIFGDNPRTVSGSDAIPLAGRCIDPQEGELEGEWRSDVDGTLGTGNFIPDSNLSTGTHDVTLTCTDADDNTVEANLTVTVQ